MYSLTSYRILLGNSIYLDFLGLVGFRVCHYIIGYESFFHIKLIKRARSILVPNPTIHCKLQWLQWTRPKFLLVHFPALIWISAEFPDFWKQMFASSIRYTECTWYTYLPVTRNKVVALFKGYYHHRLWGVLLTFFQSCRKLTVLRTFCKDQPNSWLSKIILIVFQESFGSFWSQK